MTEIEINREDVKLGTRWSPEEVAELERLHAQNCDTRLIAAKLGRTPWSINYKRGHLGLRSRSEVSRYKSTEPIAQLVAEHFNLSVPAMQGRAQFAQILWPRQIAMWLALTADRGVAHTGRYFGRDHATVLHGWRKVEKLRQRDDSVRELTDALLATLLENASAPPPAPVPEPEPPPTPDDELPANDALVPFYEPLGGSGAKNTRAYLEEQNERFAAAMRAALEGTSC